MSHFYWSDWAVNWVWILWFGFVVLMLLSFGNWGYTYRVHQKYNLQPRKRAFNILDERYARGEITRAQYGELKSDVSRD